MFGSKNPKRVAESQLNQARLDLLEVCTSLESYESNKRTLEARIARLESYLADEPPVPAQAARPPVQRVREEARQSASEVSSMVPRANY